MKSNTENNSFELLFNVYIFIKKYLILILVFLILGIAFGIYKYKSQSASFKKEILIYSDDVPYLLLKQFTNSLSKNIELGNYKKLSENLFLDEKIARKIISVNTDSISLKGKVYALNTFVFTDTSGTSKFSENYIKYLTSVGYLNNMITENNIRYKKLLEKIDLKLSELDFIQSYYKDKQNSNVVMMLEGSFKEYIELYSKKLDFEEKLKRASNIDVLKEPVTMVTSGFGLIANCIIYALIFFVLSVVIGFSIDLFIKLRKFEKSLK